MADSDLKVVIHLWGDRALVGIQQKDCDPVVEPVQAATLQEVLAAVPGLVARARERWATSPRNPAYQGPPPPPPPPRPQTTAVARPAGRPAAPQGGMSRML